LAVGTLLAGLGQAEITHKDQKWTLTNGQIEVALDCSDGAWSVLDKASGEAWRTPPVTTKGGPRWWNARRASGMAEGIIIERNLPLTEKAAKDRPKPPALVLTITLVAGRPELVVEADTPERSAPIGEFPLLEPLVASRPGAAIAVADYSNGHLYPVEADPFPRGSFRTSRLDMPWVGVCNMDRGSGYMMIIETSDDGFVQLRKLKVDGRNTVGPVAGVIPCKREFAYPRRVLYHFAARGGYVALAKRYREYAQQQGLIVPFAQKLKKNPNIQRLFGAPDVWGNSSVRFAREAKSLGVEKMLIHGKSSMADMKAINELGYLTSNYDNYTDVFSILPGKGVDSSHDRVPENVVLQANGERMKAWLTFDKKQQYMKRCPAVWLAAARQVIPKDLEQHPFVGRFIDVTTAEDLYECYDESHPLTRGQKRQCGVQLLTYVRSLNLVTGGEHGIWWGVPQLDYIEGMMSGGYASWPAGHLLHPKSKDQDFTGPSGWKYPKWEQYAKWGIGHEYRVPLWELVFHDCVVSTWYWGDASDFLLTAAPEVTPKKDAYNVLYGTIPLLWANKEGSWNTNRDAFLRTYRNTCKLHEVLAGTELVAHEFVTPDRAVQRTRFSDGTEAIVNFGAQSYTAKLAGRDYQLPENGWAVKGPKIEQSLELKGGRAVTTIRTPTYQFTESR
jgi:hypothetical protein